MIDFTNFPMRNKTYAGANGSKISVLYNGEQYIVHLLLYIVKYFLYPLDLPSK